MTSAAVGVNSERKFTADQNEVRQFISFVVGERHYCVDIAAVGEIKQWAGVTRLPNSAPHMRGVMNLRGAIVPVIDMRSLFGEGVTEPTPTNVVVIVEIGSAQHGMLVDSVSDIVTVNSAGIVPLPGADHEDRNRYFEGIVTGQDKLMAIVSPAEVSGQRLHNARS
jgi:purine-binding chemotaxis protein CheW